MEEFGRNPAIEVKASSPTSIRYSPKLTNETLRNIHMIVMKHWEAFHIVDVPAEETRALRSHLNVTVSRNGTSM